MNIKTAFRKNPLQILVLTCAILSAVSFTYLWTTVSSVNEDDLEAIFPATRYQVLFYLSLPLLALAPFLLSLTIIGTYLLTRAWMKDVIINIISESQKKVITSNKLELMSEEEKLVLKILIDNKPEMIQSDLVVKSNLSKWKITRILNKLEGWGLVSRQKYGITNMVQLLIDVDFPIT